MRILVINCGSSSIKYELFDMTRQEVLTSGLMESIGEKSSKLTHNWKSDDGINNQIVYKQPIDNHGDAFAMIRAALRESGGVDDFSQIDGVGHRVVHGGEFFRNPTLIDGKVMADIKSLSPLAPLHNPANLTGIEIAMSILPDKPQVAVFDTSFHSTIPAYASRYAIPEKFYQHHGVRRYGFHGTSHSYVAKQAAGFLGVPRNELDLITLHLGNGASAAAIKGGICVDTSMGLTPLEGLIMGTRSGDIDPAIPFYLAKQAQLSFAEIEQLLNKNSGLKGLCGENDMREIQRLAESGNENANLAIDMYCYRIKKYIGAYYAVLEQLQAIVFTAGIGENSALIREKTCSGLNALGIVLDAEKNLQHKGNVGRISADTSPITILVIPTDEELEIAQQVLDFI